MRGGLGRSSGKPPIRGWATGIWIHAIPELSSHLEEGKFLWLHFGGRSGVGVTPQVSAVVANLEAPEAANLDPLAAFQSLLYRIEDCLDDLLRPPPWHLARLTKMINQIRPRHLIRPRLTTCQRNSTTSVRATLFRWFLVPPREGLDSASRS